jgi:hypothetical protein
VVLALVGALLGALPGGAGGATARAAVTDLASADALPTPQVNGIVFSVAIVGTTAYAAGNFTTARPAGVAVGGTGEVARSNLLAFDLATGKILPFSHTIASPPFTSASDPGPFCEGTGVANQWVCDSVYRVKASADGSKIYIVGDFNSVDGQSRYRVAAFDTLTGALDPTFRPAASSRVRALAIGTSAIYLGGAFTSVGGVARTRVVAVDLTGKVITSFAASADNEVWAAALSQPQDRLVLGGKFAAVNGVAIPGLASVFTSTGASAPWSSRPIYRTNPANPAFVSDIQVVGSTAFVGGVGRGGYPAFEGRLAADVNTGDLIWENECHGDTQALAVAGGVVYSASHAHDCAKVNGWPNADWNGGKSMVYQRLLAESAAPAGTNQLGQSIAQILPWFPTLDPGPTTSPWHNGPWAIATDGVNVVVGGEFLTSNGVAQQGLTRFKARSQAPRKSGPLTPWPAPVVTAAVPGRVRVSFLATWDRDGTGLTYKLYRGNTLIGTTPSDGSFWIRPTYTYTDTAVTAGQAYTYRVQAVDADGNVIGSPSSAPVTVLAGSPRAEDYAAQVLSETPLHYWRLGTAGGADAVGSRSLRFGSGATQGRAGVLTGSADTAVSFDGSATGRAWTRTSEAAPAALSVEAWFTTTSRTGGKILGFGSSTGSADSTTVDRQLYLTADGRVNFGILAGVAQKTSSTRPYNDGRWHHAVGTMGSAGMALYVDGALVGTRASTTAANAYNGYWRLGGDRLSGWTASYWGDPALQSENWPWPTADNLAGTVDEAAVYAYPLTAAQVLDHWMRGAP